MLIPRLEQDRTRPLRVPVADFALRGLVPHPCVSGALGLLPHQQRSVSRVLPLTGARHQRQVSPIFIGHLCGFAIAVAYV